MDGDKLDLKDYVIYGDTDSIFLNMGLFIEDNGLQRIWDTMDQEEKVQWTIDLSTEISNYVNQEVYNKTQKIDYNSQVEDYKILFKQEIVAGSGLWINKKKYCLNILDNEGVKPKDPLKVTGLEVIRSDTPTAVVDMLKEIMLDILLGLSDDELMEKVDKYKEELRNVLPEEIAVNKSCKNIKKYISEDNSYVKGTPQHIKGVANYNTLLKEFSLQDDYPEIENGEKAKTVYLKPNPWNLESVTFTRWPNEFFDKGIMLDYEKMIEKNFTKKINMLLEPMNKEALLSGAGKALNLFF